MGFEFEFFGHYINMIAYWKGPTLPIPEGSSNNQNQNQVCFEWVAQDVRRLSWWSVREPPQSAWENSRPFATPPLVSLRNDVLGIGTSAEIPHWWRMGSVVPDLWEVAALQNVSYFLRLPTQLTKLITLISYPDLTLPLLAARDLGTRLTLKIGEMKLGACYALILFPLFVSACSLLVTKKISVRSQEHWTVQKKTDEKKRAEKMI